jgi:hypothetical protein
LGNYQIRKIEEHFNRDRAVISQDLKNVELILREDKDSLTCFELSAMIFPLCFLGEPQKVASVSIVLLQDLTLRIFP